MATASSASTAHCFSRSSFPGRSARLWSHCSRRGIFSSATLSAQALLEPMRPEASPSQARLWRDKHPRRPLPAPMRASPAVAGPASETLVANALESLLAQRDLSAEETHNVVEAMLQQDAAISTGPSCTPSSLSAASTARLAAFLALLRCKGETSGEVAGLARAMLARATLVYPEAHEPASTLVDIVGTGGDGSNSVNISTGSCVLAAAAGAAVAKHGNRSASSLCGSGDVVEALGLPIDLGPEGAQRCLREVGIAFLFAPRYHPYMAALAPLRRALRVRTTFNLLGPLLNPAQARHALVGVYSFGVAPLLGQAMSQLGAGRVLVVHSCGLDELTPLGEGQILEITESGTREYTLDPTAVGISRCSVEDLRGGDAAVNAKILENVLAGESGAVANALILNAGAALYAAGIAPSLQDGVQRARETHRSGAAADVLQRWRQVAREEAVREGLAKFVPSV